MTASFHNFIFCDISESNLVLNSTLGLKDIWREGYCWYLGIWKTDFHVDLYLKEKYENKENTTHASLFENQRTRTKLFFYLALTPNVRLQSESTKEAIVGYDFYWISVVKVYLLNWGEVRKKITWFWSARASLLSSASLIFFYFQSI